MTILASTTTHLVEYETGLLTIARRTDGYCLAFKGRGIAGNFRDCIYTHGVDRAISTWLRMSDDWRPLYKAGRVPA